MTVIAIPQKLIRKSRGLVVISRDEYEKFLNLQKILKKKLAEEVDTDSALKIYRKEKRLGKLRFIKSLADLG